MAGSYNHIIDDEGNLLENEKFVGMIENLGDAYEMAEELYGMIWYLAQFHPQPNLAVAAARGHYLEGLEYAKTVSGKGKYR